MDCRHPTRTLAVVLGFAVALVSFAAACGGDDQAGETLPPIKTTTTTTVITAPPTTRPETYTVQPGENLTQVAAKFGVTVEQLLFVNGLENPDYVQAGQEIKLPQSKPSTGTTAGD